MAIRSKIILITVTFLLSSMATIYAANWLLSQQTIIQQETDRFLKQLQPQEALLHKLEHEAGYGGFIHNFKNLVIRGDAIYHQQALIEQHNIRQFIKQFNALADDETKADLAIISDTFEQYFKRLDVLRNDADLAKLSIDAQDVIVEVDDAPAERALARINQRLKAEVRASSETIEQVAVSMQEAPFHVFAAVDSVVSHHFGSVIFCWPIATGAES